MRCYFYCQYNLFLDCFDDHVLDGAVIYAGNIHFQYGKQEGIYTEVLDNPTGNIFLKNSCNLWNSTLVVVED